MILIRGYDQAKYAQEIKQGIIGFHDMLTTLLYHDKNGYKLSDYYEKHLISAIGQHDTRNLDYGMLSRKMKEHLNLIFDPFVPYFYMTYFHILNENSEEWLEKNFQDTAHFIYAVPKLQQLSSMDETMFGRNMIGSKMIYLPIDGMANNIQMLLKKVGLIYLVQNELDASAPYGGVSFDEAMFINSMISSVVVEAFARRCNDEYDESENEFRILYNSNTAFSYDRLLSSGKGKNIFCFCSRLTVCGMYCPKFRRRRKQSVNRI